jgi:hypothetical protein
LIEKLRPDDAFSLVTFNNYGKTIIPLQFKKNIDLEEAKK